VQPLYRLHGLAYVLGHGGLHALRHQVGDKLPYSGVVVERGDDAALWVPLAGGLMENSVGANEAEQGTEVTAQAHGNGRCLFGQCIRKGNGDAMFGTLKPLL